MKTAQTSLRIVARGEIFIGQRGSQHESRVAVWSNRYCALRNTVHTAVNTLLRRRKDAVQSDAAVWRGTSTAVEYAQDTGSRCFRCQGVPEANFHYYHRPRPSFCGETLIHSWRALQGNNLIGHNCHRNIDSRLIPRRSAVLEQLVAIRSDDTRRSDQS